MLKKKGTEIELSIIPKCNLCSNQAGYDARTVNGFWAYLCETCYAKYGIGLGLGRGQKIVKAKEEVLRMRKVEYMCIWIRPEAARESKIQIKFMHLDKSEKVFWKPLEFLDRAIYIITNLYMKGYAVIHMFLPFGFLIAKKDKKSK